MRKYLQISVLLGIFGLMVFVRNTMGSDEHPVVVGNIQTPSPSDQPTPTPSSASATPSPVPAGSTTAPATPAPTPAPTMPMRKRMGMYKDGSYTGSVQDAYYGNIQVKAVISGGRITDVIFLQFPNDNGTSQSINSQADPMLTQEAIQVQSAQVDIISGASASSQAFQASLADALSQAK